MQGSLDDDRASVRLLYDDEKPRLRTPINPDILKLRRPGWVFLPLALLVAAGFPSTGLAALAAPTLGLALPALILGLSGFLVFSLGIALLFARREEKSFALVLPSMMSVLHSLLLVGFVVAAVLSRSGLPTGVQEVLTALPGPALGDAFLQLALAYCLLFLALTFAGIVAVLLFRVLGLRRVPASAS